MPWHKTKLFRRYIESLPVTEPSELSSRLRRAIDRETRHEYDVGDYWNLCEEAADDLESTTNELLKMNELVDVSEAKLAKAIEALTRDVKALRRVRDTAQAYLGASQCLCESDPCRTVELEQALIAEAGEVSSRKT